MRIALPIAVLLSVLHGTAADDFLQLVVGGKGNGSIAALAELAQNKATFATQFASTEGSSYKLVPAGSSLPVNRRNLRSDSTAADAGRRRLDIGCPNSCANSGSVKCQSLGCAYCGKCGGRRRQRQLHDDQGSTIVSSTSSRGDKSNTYNKRRSRGRDLEDVKTATEQREIETDFEVDLEQYCRGKDECELYARVMRIYSNGTVVRAN